MADKISLSAPLLPPINTWVGVVINAVSLETIAQITKLIQTYPVKHVQLTQIQASRAHKLGSYNLMQAQNPVLIASFDLLPDDKIEANE